MKDGKSMRDMFLDFQDVFFMVPLLAEECAIRGTLYRGRWYIWDRIAQGSINGPSVYGRLSALTGRMGQGMFDTTELRTQVYIDDPCSVIRGTPQRCDLLTARLVTLWLCLGWDLSYHKGQYDIAVNWIGYSIKVCEEYVTASIKEEFMMEFTTLVRDTLAKNLISIDDLRSLAGKANHIATLIYAWRPFLDQIWAAISQSKPDNAPKGKVWVKAILSSLQWLLLFWEGEPGALVRRWRLDFYLSPGIKVSMHLDASPFGLGAVLIVDGLIRAWFSSPLSHHDLSIHRQEWGNSKGQQCWEALVLLVAVKTWAPWWSEVRSSICIKCDNLAALALAAKLKGSVSSLIAKELAMVMSKAAFQPRLLEHVPGSMNFAADSLSRLHDPAGGYTIPTSLPAELEVQVPARGPAYYSTLQPNVLLGG